jgi:succinate dehydrogenase / fumarate reductase cytochrome b subunit
MLLEVSAAQFPAFCFPRLPPYNAPRFNKRIRYVSTATAHHDQAARASGGTYFLLRRLHSLTGLLFGGYLVVHLLVNATLVEGVREGNNVYQTQVNIIHSLPLLPAVEWALIYLPILYHTFYGIWIIATGQPNIDKYRYTKNYFYVLQRVSAIVLIVFIFFHVLGMKGLLGDAFHGALKFDPAAATESTRNHFNAAWWVWGIIYPVGILASCYHLANGFWTAAITWGLTVSNTAIRRWGMVCTGIFCFTFACGMTALVSLIHMGPQPITTPTAVMQK